MNTTSETQTTGTLMTAAAKTGDPAYQAYRILQAASLQRKLASRVPPEIAFHLKQHKAKQKYVR